jgi:membrane protease YdiL (CAAX protease family)
VVGVATNGSGSRATTIRFAPAFATWAAGWVAGMLLVAPLLLVAFGADGDDYTIPQLAAATAGAWLVFLAALAYTSHRYGTGRPLEDFLTHYGVSFRPLDLVGIPVGVLGQLVVIPLVYLPLRELWPDTFSKAELEERAQELADKADGWTVVLLVLVVVVGAPIVEELVYRGLLQRSMARTVMGGGAALAITSLWFALVHPSPVEYPGLFLAGLMFGAGVLLTDRIGPAVLTHAAFNATGLVMALR